MSLDQSEPCELGLPLVRLLLDGPGSGSSLHRLEDPLPELLLEYDWLG